MIAKPDTETKLSILWILVMFNMAFADILSLFIPGIHEELAAFAGDTPVANFMLIGAVIHQIPIFMIFLSRVLGWKANRRANIGAGIITIVYVVGGGSLLPHYLFIATVEVLTMLYIIRIAWQWPNPETGA
jgi:hypothetical protein